MAQESENPQESKDVSPREPSSGNLTQNCDVTGGGRVPRRANTPRPGQKAGADSATAQGQRGAEQAEHLEW